MAPVQQTSAAGVLAFLSEPEPLLKQHALTLLNNIVPQFWAEISESIADIEALVESDELPQESRNLAALIASKVYYYLAEYDEALSFALIAGPSFESERNKPGVEEYIETIISKAIDRYVKLRKDEEGGKEKVTIEPRLQNIVEGIFQRCMDEGEHKQALGVALESARLDIVTRIYELTRDTELLTYVMDAVLDTGFSLSYRNKVLNHILPLFPPLSPRSTHIYAITRLHVTLSSSSLTVPLLTSLATGGKDQQLVALQIAFDLVEGGSQDYLDEVLQNLPQGADEAEKVIYDKLRKVLRGEESIRLYHDFLQRNNRVDMLILKNTKEALDSRSSIYHTGLTLQNAFMHSGTSSDVFLRDNLDWLGRASNWSKFSATAALGVIHKGNVGEGMRLLGPYLPSEAGGGPGSSAFSEGGALYALGLINAGRGKDVIGYLREKLKATNDETVQHGAALGLGVAGMGTGNQEAFEDLKATLYTDSAVAGEAAGYAMGLVLLGTGNGEHVESMLQYARETQHEKIIRGLAVGIAFVYYGRQEQADQTINILCAEKDPILRYGGIYTIALAYAGTSDNGALKKLLHIAVSDTSDDVRRAAVTSLAFLLFKNPGQVPRMVQLLSESYNPHVRCGATLALGISCAGTGSQDAVDILEPMTKDPVDFVRQGAFVSLAMILIQQSDAASRSIANTRALFSKIIADKHEDPMARFGASLAQGLIDAGGRNVTISLQSRSGSRNMSAIVGMALFTQFWYWYPLAHCACLAFQPTAIIGLTEEMKAPVFEFVSNARPSLFAYPASTKPPTKESVEKVATAVLSTTAKAKAREKTKEKKAAADAMDMDEKLESKPAQSPEAEMKDATDETKKTDVEMKDEGTTTKRRTPEPTSEKLSNFSRVTPAQLSYIRFPLDGRFHPVRAVTSFPVGKPSSSKSERYAGGGGIIILVDRTPGAPNEWVQPFASQDAAPAPATDAPEADPPPAFEYPFEQST